MHATTDLKRRATDPSRTGISSSPPRPEFVPVHFGRSSWPCHKDLDVHPVVSPIPMNVWGTNCSGRRHSLIPRSFSSSALILFPDRDAV